MNIATRIAKEIHDALITNGLGRREIFPFSCPKVFLPCRPDKITTIDSGVVPKVMRRRRHDDPVECYSAVAFWQWAKAGRSYDEATLIQVLEKACRNLPDVSTEPESDKIGGLLARSARSISAAPPKSLTKATPPVRVRGITDLQDDPDSFCRQRNALLMLCRARREVVGVDDALDFIQSHRLYTGDWHEGLARRTTRVRQILPFIAKTFNKDLCRSRPLALDLRKYRQWASCCRGWRGPDRVAMDEYGRISRGRCRSVVGPKFLAVFMAVVEYCLITDKNDDDSVPQERAKAIWNSLYESGQTKIKYCPRKWAICRNKLEDLGIIRIDHTHYHGQAMKWWPVCFPSQPKRVRGMLDAVPLQQFLERREEHNSLLQHFANKPCPTWSEDVSPPFARGSPGDLGVQTIKDEHLTGTQFKLTRSYCAHSIESGGEST